MVNRLIDSEVNKTLFSEMGWQRQQAYGEGKTGLRKKRTKFGTSCNLPILERVKCELTAAGSATAQTIIYVVKDGKELLLGLKYGEALGIILIQAEGENVKKLNTLTMGNKHENSKKEMDADENYRGIRKGIQGIRKGF